MDKKLYSKETDTSWKKLHARFIQDGLLKPEMEKRSFKKDTVTETNTYAKKRTVMWWGLALAAVVLLCVFVASALLLTEKMRMPEKQNLLTQCNTEGTSTLVKTLEDGSIVYLSENTSLQYPKHFSANERRVSLSGNALFDVAGNKSRPFYIETAKVRIIVVGTAFNVRSSSPDSFELAVSRGVVRVVINNNEREVRVKAGETVKLEGDKFLKRQTTDIRQFDQYTKQLRFKDEKLGNILRVMNMKSSKVKLCTLPDLENRTMTVSFSTETPDEIAELICLALNLHASKRNQIITISE